MKVKFCVGSSRAKPLCEYEGEGPYIGCCADYPVLAISCHKNRVTVVLEKEPGGIVWEDEWDAVYICSTPDLHVDVHTKVLWRRPEMTTEEIAEIVLQEDR